MKDFTISDIVAATQGELLCGDKDCLINNMATNSSKTEGLMFVPIIGERVDGHRFIGDAFAHGAVASLTSSREAVGEFIEDGTHPIVLVEDTVPAIQNIARAYEKRLNLPKVGITGSVGKTTTKEMIACALSGGLNVFKTAGNANSQIGVPITIMDIMPEHEAAVIEMGMSEEGEMERLARLLSLNAVVMTNIGVSHIEQLKTQDNILKEKWHITDALVKDGGIYLNGDDTLLRERADKCKTEGMTRVYTYGTSTDCDYVAQSVRVVDGGLTFDACFDGQVIPVRLNVLGNHNVLNALVAIAVAVEFGVDPYVAAKALEGYSGVAMRQQITVKNGITIIDDSYNASPDSMRAGLSVLAQTISTRKIAVLADMLELGDKSPEYHRAVGEYAGELGIDELVIYGELAKNIGEGALDKVNKIKHFDNLDEVTAFLKSELVSGDAVLLKASRGMKLNLVADALKECL